MSGIGIGKQFGGSNLRKIIYNAGLETSLEYFTTSRVKTTVPQIRLVFSPWFLPYVPLEILSQDVGGLILECDFVKGRVMPHGSVSVSMVADDKAVAGIFGKNEIRTIKDILQPRTLCQLWLDGYHVFTGYVRSIIKNTQPGKRKTYDVEFDELGGLYQQNIIDYMTIQDGAARSIIDDPWKILSKGSRKLTGTLAKVVYKLVDAFRASTLNFGTKGYLRASDGLPMAYRLVTAPPPLGTLSLVGILSQMIVTESMYSLAGGSSFWDFLKQFVPMPYMEMFTESGGRTMCTGRAFGGTDINTSAPFSFSHANLSSNPFYDTGVSALLPGFNYLVLRSVPYDNLMIGSSAWHGILRPFTLDIFDLIISGDFCIVTDDDVISKSLGISDDQQYTVFNAPMPGGAGSGNGVTLKNRASISNGPINPLSPGGIRTYGAVTYNAPVKAISVSWKKLIGQQIETITRRVGQPPTLIGVSALSSMLNYWFRNAGKFNEGSITTRFMPYAKPGMALLYLPSLSSSDVDDLGDIAVYYIDSISHSYKLGEASTTTFSVIRGVPLPLNAKNIIRTFLDWEILPVSTNLSEADEAARAASL